MSNDMRRCAFKTTSAEWPLESSAGFGPTGSVLIVILSGLTAQNGASSRSTIGEDPAEDPADDN